MPALRLAQRLRPLPAARQLAVTVSLRVRDQAALDDFLRAVYDPSSPSYRRFLTPQQFAQRFGPTTASRAAVSSWLTGQGLQVLGTSTNGLQIAARGSVSRLQAAFGTSLYSFKENGRTFFANSGPISLPGTVLPNVVAVTGLASSAQQTTPVTHAQAKQALPGYSPTDLAGIYDYAPLISQGITGSGQTIAVATFGDYSPSDIATFDQQYGLGGKVTRITVDGGASLGAKNGQDETESDIEMVQGTARGATILVYEAPNSTTSNQTVIDLYSRIVNDNRAAIVTTSWGSAESELSSSDLSALNQLLQEGAAQGQAFFAASGDSGAYDDAGNGPSSDTTLAVDFPASDPWVTGVGGTSLQDSGGQYVGETAWSDSSNRRGPVGSGGGLSSVFSRPAYQAGPGVDNQYSNGKRQVPDVAADADPATGYTLYTVDQRGNPGWTVAGGTSMAAPLWAGFAALVNQAVGRRIGFLNPALYQLGQKASTFSTPPFHDVTQGDNLNYPATPGWDFATGWGSFDGAAFVADLKTLPAAPATSTPLPTPTQTSVATSPGISISKVILLHRVNGKLQSTNSLKIGETGTIVILYKTKSATSLKAYGSVLVRQNGQLLEAIALKATTYGGKPALSTTIRFTSKKRVGTILAHVTVSLGPNVAALDRTFKLGLK
ncbi:MAG: S8/S53 family peptidase [Chloroflexi bacterium]|nr:S8/S53 family peptidase [Chloroflexota bacterium]